MDEELLSEYKLVKDWIDTMNWTFFCRIDEPVYPDLAKEFYTNMQVDEVDMDVLHTNVRGTAIEVDVHTLSHLLSVDPSEGTKLREAEDAQIIVGKDFANYLMPKVPVKELIATTLPKVERICHYLVVNFIMPKMRSVNSVSKKERGVMWHILKNKKLNLPVLIISQMKKATGTLPYGSLITCLLKKRGVRIDDTDVKCEVSVIDSATLDNLQHSKAPKRKASDAEDKVRQQSGKKVRSKTGPHSMQHQKVVRKRSTSRKNVAVNVKARESESPDLDIEVHSTTKSRHSSGESSETPDGPPTRFWIQSRRGYKFGEDGEAVCGWQASSVQQVKSVQSKSLRKIEDIQQKVAETVVVIQQDPPAEADCSEANADPETNTKIISTEPLPTLPSIVQTQNHAFQPSTQTFPSGGIRNTDAQSTSDTAYMNQQMGYIKAYLQTLMDLTSRPNRSTCTHQLQSIERALSELSVKMDRVTRGFGEKEELFGRSPGVSKVDAIFEMVNTLTSNSFDKEGICKMSLLIEMLGNLSRRVVKLEGMDSSQENRHATESNSKLDKLNHMMTAMMKDFMETEEQSQQISNSVYRLSARVSALERRRNEDEDGVRRNAFFQYPGNSGQINIPSDMVPRQVGQGSHTSVDIVSAPNNGCHTSAVFTTEELDVTAWADVQTLDPIFDFEDAFKFCVDNEN